MLFKLSYLLQRYRFWGAPLQRWLALSLALLALLCLLRVLPGGAPAALLCLLLIPLSYAWNTAARRSQYVQFHRSRDVQPPGALRLNPAERVTARATGQFEVSGKQRRYSETPAQYQSFATREHALIVTVAEVTRLRGLVRGPEGERGMWYLFFQPTELRSVEPGILRFGLNARIALRLEIGQILQQQSPSDAWGIPRSSRDKSERRQIVYLSFTAPEDRNKVWGDLLADT